ncbi:hypothetical protein ACL03I_07305 [Nocardia sp. SC052]
MSAGNKSGQRLNEDAPAPACGMQISRTGASVDVHRSHDFVDPGAVIGRSGA